MADADRIAVGGEHNGYCVGRTSGRLDLVRSRGEDDVDLHSDELGCQLRQMVDGRSRPVLDNDVLTFDPSEIAQPSQEGLKERVGRRRNSEDPDDLSRLLRASADRPAEPRSTEQGYELPSLHSITSSARSRIEAGTDRPSSRAVLRLTISSNLIGRCKIGRASCRERV